MTYPVGTSSYQDGSTTSPHGQMQVVATQDAADQVNSLCYEFDTQKATNGDRLSVNEGIRSRERQLELYQAWKNGTGALAANPYTSTHDSSRGSALDFGITTKDGGNRAPTADEWTWIHARAAARGIQHTGQYFNPEENWHHNAGYAASLAPIPGVRLANSPIPATHTNSNTTDWLDMALRLIPHPSTETGVTANVKGGWYLHNIENGKKVVVTSPDDLGKLRNIIYGDGTDSAGQIFQQEIDVMTARYITPVL